MRLKLQMDSDVAAELMDWVNILTDTDISYSNAILRLYELSTKKLIDWLIA